MAEIRDVYTVEFDSTAFEQQIQNAVAQIDQLNASLEDSADATNSLESSTSQLNSILKTEATGIDQLNSKRNVLVNTQQSLNKESAAYNQIGGEINNTNKQIATTTARTTTKSKGLFGTFLRGARSLNTVRRSVSLLNVAFRTIAGVSVFGLLLQAVPAVLRFFGQAEKQTVKLTDETERLNSASDEVGKAFQKETAELNNLFGALNDTNEGSQERSEIISEIQSKYGDYIGNIDLETASQEQLKEAYDAATAAILGQVVAQAKAARARAIVNEIIDRQVALVKEQRELEDRAAQVAVNNATAIRQQEDAINQLNPALRNQVKTFDETVQTLGQLNDAFAQGDTDKLKRELEDLDETFTQIEKKLREELVGIIDPSLLTGSFEKAAGSATDKSEVLAGSLRDLRNQLSLLQQQQEQATIATDSGALIAIEKQIAALNTQIVAAEAALDDFRNQAAARERIEKLQTELIEDESAKRIEVLRRAANNEIENVIGSESQKAEQRRLISERLTRDIEALLKDRTDKENDAIKAGAERTREELKAINEQRISDAQSNAERLLSVRLQEIEAARNAELQTISDTITDAELRNQAVEDVNKQFDADRVRAERETQSEILRIQIAAIQARIEVQERAGESVSEERAEIEALKLELIELGRIDPTIDITVNDDDAKEKLKETITEIADTVEQISNELLSSVGEFLAVQTAALDASVQRSRDALATIRQDSENFNARQLELEKQRLERLEAQRARAAEREKAIALTQLTVNSLVAVSKAAAEGGILAPFTIASTIVALLAGFASARSASENAFFEGTEYVDPHNKYPAGRDTVPARLHKGERVITTATNREYWNTLSAIHKGDVPSDVLNDFVSGYMRDGMSPNAMTQLSPNIVLVNTGSNSGGVEKRLERIENVLSDLPKYMPRTTVTGNMGGLLRVVEKRAERARFNDNRAK